MSLITPLEMNIDWTRSIYEEESQYCFINLINKIALYTIFPIAMIAAFEGIVKNFICINLANLGIALINGGYDLSIYLRQNWPYICSF